MTLLTNERVLFENSCGSLLDCELACTSTVPYRKGWANGRVPEGSNEEEEHSTDDVIRPFRTSLMAIITPAHRQFGLKELVVFLHSTSKVPKMPMFEYEGSTCIAR